MSRRRVDTRDWQIVHRDARRSGVRYALNVVNGDGGAVTVKQRFGKGEPWLCNTCHLNACEHIAFVQAHPERHDAPTIAVTPDALTPVLA